MADKEKTTKVHVSGVEKKANVYERIYNIQQSIHTVIKGGFNDHFKYKFARERDVVAEVKPLLGTQRLAITNTLKKEEEVEHGKTSKGDPKYLTKLTFTFRITNIDEPTDFVEADAVGYGQDQEDKGAPKAYTMALKYFLSKQFLIETGDDAEESRTKAPAKGAAAGGDKFDTALRMIQQSRNFDGLIEYRDKLKESKTFTAPQKKDLEAALGKRIAELEPETGAQ